MQAVGIHHVALNVTDLDEALAFYTGPLGMAVRTDRPELGLPGAWLDIAPGGGQVHLLQIAPPTSAGQHVAIQVGDLAAVVDELRAAGVTVSDPSAIATSLQASAPTRAATRSSCTRPTSADVSPGQPSP